MPFKFSSTHNSVENSFSADLGNSPSNSFLNSLRNFFETPFSNYYLTLFSVTPKESSLGIPLAIPGEITSIHLGIPLVILFVVVSATLSEIHNICFNFLATNLVILSAIPLALSLTVSSAIDV